MKVMFDTNVYISFIRNRTHREELQRRGTVKYLSAMVLMELWAGARTRKSERLLYNLQKPYKNAGRIITLNIPPKYGELVKRSGFLNDVQIAVTALSIGATLFTENVTHFDIIHTKMKSLKLEYLRA